MESMPSPIIEYLPIMDCIRDLAASCLSPSKELITFSVSYELSPAIFIASSSKESFDEKQLVKNRININDVDIQCFILLLLFLGIIFLRFAIKTIMYGEHNVAR